METVLFLVPNVSVTFWSVFARPRDLGHCSQIQRWRQETCRFDAWPRQIYPTLEDTAPTQGLNFRSCIWAHKFYKCKTSQTALFGEPEEPTVFATCAILHPSCRWRPEVQWSCVLMGWKISGFEEDFDRFWQCFQTALKTRWATEPKSKTAHSTPFFLKKSCGVGSCALHEIDVRSLLKHCAHWWYQGPQFTTACCVSYVYILLVAISANVII